MGRKEKGKRKLPPLVSCHCFIQLLALLEHAESNPDGVQANIGSLPSTLQELKFCDDSSWNCHHTSLSASLIYSDIISITPRRKWLFLKSAAPTSL
jgi:hypothetical protein